MSSECASSSHSLQMIIPSFAALVVIDLEKGATQVQKG